MNTEDDLIKNNQIYAKEEQKTKVSIESLKYYTKLYKLPKYLEKVMK